MFIDVGQLIRVVNESHRACVKIAELNIIRKIKFFLHLFQESYCSAEKGSNGLQVAVYKIWTIRQS